MMGDNTSKKPAARLKRSDAVENNLTTEQLQEMHEMFLDVQSEITLAEIGQHFGIKGNSGHTVSEIALRLGWGQRSRLKQRELSRKRRAMKRQYQNTSIPIREIAAQHGISRIEFHRIKKQLGWKRIKKSATSDITRGRLNIKRRNLRSHLITLGAPASELPGRGLREWASESGIDILHWAESLWKSASRRYHPDAGGSDAEMADINAAYDSIKKIMSRNSIGRKMIGR